MPDFNSLTVVQVVSTAILIAALDIAVTMALAIVHQNFSLGVMAVWLQSHVLRRVFPILGLALLGHGISLGDTVLVPEVPIAFAGAIAALVAYAGETLKSLQESFSDTTPPTDTTPIP